ncbi:hypothetical protein MLD38_030525 [Melastoma candidum]|uniref:Uncharacterized protein n=1 Tax=Melastoma candidum TaxID=119954 RepID=A0ACB9MM11_9MYRT|nr:hypothetical protein MLD38_030525 [Melastoma candidum]
MWVFDCRQPSQGAFKLGLDAGFLLCSAPVLTNLLGGCYNCVCTQEELQKASPNQQLTMACLIITWVILAISLSMIVIGTLSNNNSKTSCGFTHHHFMSMRHPLLRPRAVLCRVSYVCHLPVTRKVGKTSENVHRSFFFLTFSFSFGGRVKYRKAFHRALHCAMRMTSFVSGNGDKRQICV